MISIISYSDRKKTDREPAFHLQGIALPKRKMSALARGSRELHLENKQKSRTSEVFFPRVYRAKCLYSGVVSSNRACSKMLECSIGS